MKLDTIVYSEECLIFDIKKYYCSKYGLKHVDIFQVTIPRHYRKAF